MDSEAIKAIKIPFPEQFNFYWPEFWPSWLKYFERYLSLQDLTSLTEKKKIDILCYAMGPESDKILMRLIPEYEHCSYEAIKETLSKYFSPHCNVCNGLENLQVENVPNPDNLEMKKRIRYTVKNISEIKGDKPFHYSPEFRVNNIPFQILIRKRFCNQQTFLSISLWCYEIGKSGLRNKIEGHLRLISQNIYQLNFSVRINHVFRSLTHFWESTHFMRWEDVLNEETGFIKDDSINIELDIDSMTFVHINE